MSAPVFNMNNYARTSSERSSDEAFLDPSLSVLRSFRTRAYFWDPHTNDAMALRNEKFKIHNHEAQRFAAARPTIEPHYEEHFTAGSRQPRIPAPETNTPMVQQLQPGTEDFRPKFPWWTLLLILVMLLNWT